MVAQYHLCERLEHRDLDRLALTGSCSHKQSGDGSMRSCQPSHAVAEVRRNVRGLSMAGSCEQSGDAAGGLGIRIEAATAIPRAVSVAVDRQ